MKPAAALRRPSERMHLLTLHLLLLLLGSSTKAGEIIGGTECIPHSRPYMAYLEIVTSENYLSACSGFLIRRNFVLTAAHCAGRSITVLLGAHNKTSKEDTWQKLEVEKQFLHPKYDENLVVHDIMLLKLKEKAKLTLGVGTLPLSANFNFIPPGRMCRAVGWGRTNVNEPASDTLQEVKMRLQEPQACKHFTSFRHNSQLCVGNPKKMQNVYKVCVCEEMKATLLLQARWRLTHHLPWTFVVSQSCLYPGPPSDYRLLRQAGSGIYR